MNQYAAHIVSSHTTEVAADIPDGMVQLKFGPADGWITVPVDDAMELIGSAED